VLIITQKRKKEMNEMVKERFNTIAELIREGYREKGIPTGSTGRVLSGVNIVDYEQCKQRLLWAGNYVVHPRTNEIILGTSLLERKRIPHGSTKHLQRFPHVAYHQRINQVQVSGKFVVQPHEKTTPTDYQKLNYQLQGELLFKKTSQIKTVWYTRYNRRR
jgi:hypothetical protein